MEDKNEKFLTIQAAVADGTLPPYTSLDGYGDLRKNENVGTDKKVGKVLVMN